MPKMEKKQNTHCTIALPLEHDAHTLTTHSATCRVESVPQAMNDHRCHPQCRSIFGSHFPFNLSDPLIWRASHTSLRRPNPSAASTRHAHNVNSLEKFHVQTANQELYCAARWCWSIGWPCVGEAASLRRSARARRTVRTRGPMDAAARCCVRSMFTNVFRISTNLMRFLCIRLYFSLLFFVVVDFLSRYIYIYVF